MLIAQNPYPKTTYREKDASFFFGRETQLRELQRKICTRRFVLLTGAANVGKTSLLHGGLIPQLKSRGYKGLAGTRWKVSSFIPDANPLEDLLQAVARRNVLHPDEKLAPTYQDTIRRRLKQKNGQGLIDAYWESESIKDHNLLIVVDPCDRFFDQKASDDHQLFINLLYQASQDPETPIYVVVGVRSESVEKVGNYEKLQPFLSQAQYPLYPLSQQELDLAIRGPIEASQANIEEALRVKLLTKFYQAPDQLSQLQSALCQIWQVWYSEGKKGPISMKHYSRAMKELEIGVKEKDPRKKSSIQINADQAKGQASELESITEADLPAPEILGPIQLAEKVLAGMSQADQQLSVQLFQSLTKQNQETRQQAESRPSMIEDMAMIIGVPPQKVISLAAPFREKDLEIILPSLQEEVTPYSTLEIARIGLAQEWPSLLHWMEQEGKDADQYIFIAEKAKQQAQISPQEKQNILHWWKQRNPKQHWAEQYAYNFGEVEQYVRRLGGPPPPPKPPTPPPVQQPPQQTSNKPAERPPSQIKARPKIKINRK